MSSPVFESAFSVFSALRTSTKVVHDDTQVEKFICWVNNAAGSQDAANIFLSNPEVDSFLSHAASHDEDDPYQALLIALRIGPILLQASNINNSSHQDYPSWISVFQAAQRKEPWSEASVRNAWILGLDKMFSTDTGFIWSLQSGHLEKLVDLLGDESIFVRKEAQKLILKGNQRYCPKSDSINGKLSQDYEDLNVKVWRAIRAPLMDAQENPIHADIGTSLEFLQSICRNENLEESNLLAKVLSDEKLVMDLLLLLENQLISQRRSLVTEIVSTIQDIVDLQERNGKPTDLIPTLEKWPVHLLRKHNIYSAMALASTLLNSALSIGGDEMLKTVALLPLRLISDPSLVSEVKDLSQDITETLHSKALQVESILQTLRIIETTEKLRDSGVIKDLIKLLNITLSPEHVSKNTGDGLHTLRLQMSRTSFHHNKIQMALLDLFIQLHEKDAVADRDTELIIIEGCLRLLDRHGIPAPLSNKAYSCILVYLTSVVPCGTVEESGTSLTTSLTTLASRIKMGLCDVAWEVRDSALELIDKLIKTFKDESVVSRWMVSERLVEEIWRSVDDGQSYVRASAILALSDLPYKPSLWQQLLTVTTQEEIVDKLSSIIKNDTEAFARRAAVRLLCEWSSCTALSTHRSLILTTIHQAMTDLDWEVKMTVLNYWSDISDTVIDGQPDNVPEYARGVLSQNNGNIRDDFIEKLQKINTDYGLRSLLIGLIDYDQCVQCKACKILLKIKSECEKHGVCQSNMDEPSSKRTKYEKELSEVLNGESGEWRRGMSWEGFVKILESLDLDELMRSVSESTDNYVRNPRTLFDDILSSLANDDDGEDNAIDCY